MILNKQVGVFINLVHNRIKQYLSTIFQESGFNITPEQFLVMDALWNNGVISQQELASIILKDKNSIVKLVDGLEKKGLVVRVADKVDRRKNLIELTDYAHCIREKVIDAAMEAINQIIKEIPEEEIQVFIKVLSKMASNMDEDTDLLALAAVSHPQKETTAETESEPSEMTQE